MSGWYTITITAWPFSTGKGREEEYRIAGPEKREFTVKAADFVEACRHAETFQAGIKSSGHVWEAPIRSITYCGEMRP